VGYIDIEKNSGEEEPTVRKCIFSALKIAEILFTIY
jgi:hypothetical protein